MSLNVGKCAYATTTHIPSIMVHLDPNNASTPWVCPMAQLIVPYLGLRLDPKGMAFMKEKHVLRCEALLGWCKNILGPPLVPHEVTAAMVGGVVRYAGPYMSDITEEVVRLNAAIKTAAVQFENLPTDLSNVVVRCGKGLKLADIRVPCCHSVVVTVHQLTHHCSAVTKGELRALPDHLHTPNGVCGRCYGSVNGICIACGKHVGRPSAKVDGNAGGWSLMVSSVYWCVHTKSVASARGRAAMGDVVLHLQG